MKIDTVLVDYLLTTTRSVRKRLDLQRPVDPEVLARCIEIALQAPTGSNEQLWHFMVVTEVDKKKALADLYKKGFFAYRASQDQEPSKYGPGDPRAEQKARVVESATYLVLPSICTWSLRWWSPATRDGWKRRGWWPRPPSTDRFCRPPGP